MICVLGLIVLIIKTVYSLFKVSKIYLLVELICVIFDPHVYIQDRENVSFITNMTNI